ncbi:DUF1659 domain-containing protein [Desulfosporosinus sp. PR]|uniref:DUF1659 domain-containing protein n=1 Tax=Candidatus Desulfosporosinus nitrosoreducens TaxID=3401928 RepID=UPI0027F1C4D7|nr:DUF1659 domain-containing protein [Desulfosporosinus sp. PR]MDQ7092610.1 DUF1659 domain-containing protein [Desulfosporosinus sp. PR]
MAVVATPLDSALVVAYQNGTTPAGAPITRLKSLSYVRADAQEQALYEVAQALFSLSLHPILDVTLRKNFQLTDE